MTLSRDRHGCGTSGGSRLDAPQSVSQYLPFVDAYQDVGLAAVAEPMRRAILQRLAERPRAVGELAATLPISRPAVSQHLRVLKAADLVSDAAVGTRRVYRLNPAGVAALRDQLDAFWTRTLSGYQDAIGTTTEQT